MILYTKNEQSEKEIKKTSPFTEASKKINTKNKLNLGDERLVP